jgi:hypothetical protein
MTGLSKLIGFAAVAFVGVCHSSASNGDYRFETSDFLKQTAYSRPSRVAANPDESGALSRVNILWDRDHSVTEVMRSMPESLKMTVRRLIED